MHPGRVARKASRFCHEASAEQAEQRIDRAQVARRADDAERTQQAGEVGRIPAIIEIGITKADFATRHFGGIVSGGSVTPLQAPVALPPSVPVVVPPARPRFAALGVASPAAARA